MTKADHARRRLIEDHDMNCECSVCTYGREVQQRLAAVPDEHRAFFSDMYDRLCNVENDRDHAHGIIEGAFPASDKVIEQARLRRSHIEKLVEQIDRMIEPLNFNTRVWVERWIREPVPALGGKRPLDIVWNAEGYEQVATLLARMGGEAFS